jgi:hypothetical protein
VNDEFGKLSPATLKANLMRASLFLTAFELLQLELVEKVQTFYAITFDENARGIASDSYREEVLSLAPPDVHPNTLRFHASCAWWVKDGTLTAANVAEIKAIKKHRDRIAHELPKILIDPAFSVDWRLFSRLCHFITVLGRFWGRVTIDSLEEYDGREMPHAAIESGPMLLVTYIEQLLNEGASLGGHDAGSH